ncbi:MAG: DMT family transporter [Desulfovibrionaceae bacterium]|nr:DMT family transporter [Desulfovibrionaceae bacterium]
MAKFFLNTEEWALVAATMLWGATFLIIRLAMTAGGPLCFVGLRFSAAALFVIILALPVLRGITRREIIGGVILGCTVFLGFTLQTYGLVTISAAKSAFITAFYVPLVPIFELCLMRHKPSKLAWVGIALAFPGVLILSGATDLDVGLGAGEIATIISAVVFALEIVAIGIIAPGTNPRRLVAVELVVTALFAFASMPLLQEPWPPFSWFFVGIAIGLGCVTALIQNLITWAQKRIPPTRATIIYTGEPVWAAIYSYIIFNDLQYNTLIGGSFIIGGILISSIKKEAK